LKLKISYKIEENIKTKKLKNQKIYI